MKLLFLTSCYLFATSPSKRVSKREEKWQEEILPSLLRYKDVYNDLLVPKNYVDPVTRINLGSLVETIRNKGTWKQKHRELLDMGFDFDSPGDIKWQSVIKPAFEQYFKIFGNLLVPQSFVVESKDPWPQDTHGLKLGKVTMAIRAGKAWRKKRAELEEMGFIFDNIGNLRWETQIYPALRRYKELHKDLQIPTDFVVPHSADYPLSTHGVKLGLVVKSIRNKDYYKSKRQELDDVGFEYQSHNDLRWNKRILPGLLVYQQIHGDLLVPAQFVIPRSHPWPEATHDLRLGSIVNHIRNNGLWESKHEQLESIGFQFGDYLESVWIKEIYPAFVSFKQIYGHLQVPNNFIVPSEPPWPIHSYG